MIKTANDINPTASYAAFLLEEGDTGIAHQFAILSGASCILALETSICPDRLEFQLLS